MPKTNGSDGMFDWDFLKPNPQVHIHYLTESAEFELSGFWKIELCCHGCHKAVLVYFLDADADLHLSIRDAFESQHACCEDRKYDQRCPNYRSSIEILDVRNRSASNEARSAESGARDSKVSRPPMAGSRRLRVRKKSSDGG